MSNDWPVDPDGEEGSEGMRKFDMRVIADKVDEQEDFPLDRDEFVGEYGDYPIRVNHETIVAMSEIFDYIDDDVTEFETILDMHKAVGKAMRAGNFWKYHPQGKDPEKVPA
ncbi:hypothetical protein BDK88_3099 [Natrinema hispanicum]|uniref:Uncharacterized protein n=1 Tax=Natrinema hispanicum TaxID=392421 RepID=A0A482Y9M2_9EURY|nr:DUF5785 family protein [Natrinema hispanicum]RZV08135.1 hypothetical protein BDK88_3099 [Natrinema hispanicum]